MLVVHTALISYHNILYTERMILPIKKTAIVIFALFAFSVFGVPCSYANDAVPRPRGAVNDFAGVITTTYERAMASLAREVLDKTETAVVVVTIKTLGGRDPAEFANRLYESWGIGHKGTDKGVLIFLAQKERRIRIETGYGVEGILPDGLVGEILDTYAVPYLKKGEYGKGLGNAMAAVSAVIARDAGVTLSGQATRLAPRTRERTGASPVSLVIFFIVLAMLLGTRQGRAMLPWILLLMLTGGRGGGGGFGGFGGGFGGFGGGMSGGGGAGRGF